MQESLTLVDSSPKGLYYIIPGSSYLRDLRWGSLYKPRLLSLRLHLLNRSQDRLKIA